MIVAGLGSVCSAIGALDAHLDPPTLAALDGQDITDAWHAASDLCKAADALAAKIRAALLQHVAGGTSHG